MIKAIFFDVDGTLLPYSRAYVPEGTKKALHALKKKGVLRILATGRHRVELEELPVRDIRFDGYLTMNGHIFLDENKRTTGGIPFTAEDQAQVVSAFREKAVPMALVDADLMYVNFVNEHVVQAHADIVTAIPPVDDYDGKTIYQAIAYLPAGEEHMLMDRIPGCIANRWFPYAIDVIPGGGGKVAGIRQFLEKNGIDPQETMAFGDAENDIEMLKFCGTGVAMGNAEEDVKACADYITADVNDDGIAKALRHFGVI